MGWRDAEEKAFNNMGWGGKPRAQYSGSATHAPHQGRTLEDWRRLYYINPACVPAAVQKTLKNRGYLDEDDHQGSESSRFSR